MMNYLMITFFLFLSLSSRFNLAFEYGDGDDDDDQDKELLFQSCKYILQSMIFKQYCITRSSRKRLFGSLNNVILFVNERGIC